MPESPANDELSAYLDGELRPEASARIERALSSDPTLQAELEQLRLVRSMLSKHGRVEAPFGFKARVLSAVAEEPAPVLSWKSWLRRPFGIPIEGFAVALAALLVIVVVGNREQAGDPTLLDNFGAPQATGGQVIVDPERDAARAQRLPTLDEAPETEPDELDVGDAGPDNVVVVQRGAAGVSTSTNELPSTRPEPMPSPEAYGVGTAEPTPAPTPVAEPVPSGTASEDTPALFGASYRYQVSTSDPDAAAQLLRLAGRYRGRVSDSSGRRISSTDPGVGGSYRVQVPAEHLAEFGAALRALGSVVERPDDRIFASSSVTIQVDLIQSNAKGTPAP